MERLGLGDELMRERYSRHLTLAEIGEAGQQKLARSSVLLVGVGGLGSAIALYLAAAGVGKLGLVDPDVVSLSNLQRQVLYTEAEVGEPKVVCAARRLQALNSQLEVACHAEFLTEQNADGLLAGYDLIVDGCDNFTTRYVMDRISAKQQKPYVYGSIGEFHGQVSVFNFEGGVSYRDLFPEENQPLPTEKPIAPPGVMGVVPGLIGCYEAAEVIKLITGAGDILAGRLLTVDLLTMNHRILNL